MCCIFIFHMNSFVILHGFWFMIEWRHRIWSCIPITSLTIYIIFFSFFLFSFIALFFIICFTLIWFREYIVFFSKYFLFLLNLIFYFVDAAWEVGKVLGWERRTESWLCPENKWSEVRQVQIWQVRIWQVRIWQVKSFNEELTSIWKWSVSKWRTI